MVAARAAAEEKDAADEAAMEERVQEGKYREWERGVKAAALDVWHLRSSSEALNKCLY